MNTIPCEQLYDTSCTSGKYVLAPKRGGTSGAAKRRPSRIHWSGNSVDERLNRLEAEHEEVLQTNIEGLKAEVNAAVNDLIDLTEDEREVVESYLRVF